MQGELFFVFLRAIFAADVPRFHAEFVGNLNIGALILESKQSCFWLIGFY